MYKQRKHLTTENLIGTYKLISQIRRSENFCGTEAVVKRAMVKKKVKKISK